MGFNGKCSTSNAGVKCSGGFGQGKLLQSHKTLLVDPYLGKNDVPELHQRFEAHEKLQTSRISQNFKIMITHDHS
jgi:L-ascorbate metabolism protein UlaG (beta-lactamase superfamily)